MASHIFFSAGVWVLLTLMPTLLLNSKKEDRPVGTRDYVGWGLWTTGFLLECIADYQKSAFRGNPANQVNLSASELFIFLN